MNRLLVAYDFSQGSGRALLRALRLAASRGAAVRVVHSIDGASPEPDLASAQHRLLTEARIMAEELGAGTLDISARARSEYAHDAILAEAAAFDADLLLMGGHGEPRFRDAIFGTTATHVVRHSDRAVLVVQDPGGEDYAQVMIAVDDPLAAGPLLGTTLALAPDAEVVAVHAFSPTFGQALAGAPEIGRQEFRLEQQVRDAVAAAAAAGTGDPARVKVRAVVETGDVLTVLMKAYETLQPQLLAIGTRERATFLGSHAVDTLFWCPHDVLVVPDRAKAMTEQAETRSASSQA